MANWALASVRQNLVTQQLEERDSKDVRDDPFATQIATTNILRDDDLFGHLAAEEEKELIARYFQETDSFKHIYQGSKYIVLGRKGSGKSAIFLYLDRKINGEGGNIANISLDQYPTQVFSKLRDAEIDTSEAHAKTWKFVLLLTLMELYVEYAKRRQLGDDTIAVYERFLRCHLDYRVETSRWERILTFLKRFKSLDVSILGIGVGLQFDPSNITKEEFGQKIHIVNTKLEEMLRASLVGTKNLYRPDRGSFFVCLDRLDEQWRNTRETNALLVGLFKAVRNLNLDIPNAKFIVFLRSDIFERLRYQNKAHISEYIERLTWSRDLLEQMIARRISARLGLNAEDNQTFVDAMWSRVFEDINGRYGGSRKQILRNFISTRSFNRPRDYISILKALQDVANKYDLPVISSEFSMGDQSRNISVDAERIYSERTYYEFQDELLDQVKNFDQIMDTIRNDIGYITFTVEEFAEALSRSKIEGNPRQILSDLFEFSIIGFDNPGGRETSTGRIGARGDEYRYQSDTLQFEINKGQFKIHPSLRRFLNLTEKRNSGQRHAVDRTVRADTLWTRSRKPQNPNAPQQLSFILDDLDDEDDSDE